MSTHDTHDAGTYYIPHGSKLPILGSIGLFMVLMLLFIRFLPMISIFEMRTILPGAELEEEGKA